MTVGITEPELPPFFETTVVCKTEGCLNYDEEITLVTTGNVTCGECGVPIPHEGYVKTGSYDDTTLMFTEVDHGQTTQRSYTAEEADSAARRQAAERNFENTESLREQARTAIDELLTSINTLQLITAKANSEITARDTKDVARETRRVARQLIRITRLVINAVDTTDSGTD